MKLLPAAGKGTYAPKNVVAVINTGAMYCFSRFVLHVSHVLTARAL